MVIKERALPRRGCLGIVPACVRMAMLVFCPSGFSNALDAAWGMIHS